MDVARETTPGKVQMLVLERRDEGCNMARFYVLAIEPTLFGDIALIREWGASGPMAGAASIFTPVMLPLLKRSTSG